MKKQNGTVYLDEFIAEIFSRTDTLMPVRVFIKYKYKCGRYIVLGMGYKKKR